VKRLIDINRNIWGKIRDFATVKDISINTAVESLLAEALLNKGYLINRGGLKQE
jgi:hypothetical protein